MVQLIREQRTFVTKTFYGTESMNVVMLLQSFTNFFVGIKECTNPLIDKICIFQFQTVQECGFNLRCIWSFHVVRIQQKYHWKAT